MKNIKQIRKGLKFFEDCGEVDVEIYNDYIAATIDGTDSKEDYSDDEIKKLEKLNWVWDHEKCYWVHY